MPYVPGTNASEPLFGTPGDDTLEGFGGNDSLQGKDGNDVYFFSGAFGIDNVTDDSGVDQVRFGADYSFSDLRLLRGVGSTDDDLFIILGTGANYIQINNFFDVATNLIESIRFDQNGVVLNLNDGSAFANAGFKGTNASETVLGSNGDDLLIGLGGNDFLAGDSGNDTYFFSGAFGQDNITDASGVDRIRIGNDYSEVNFRPVRGTGAADDDFFIIQGTGSNFIRLNNYYDDPANLIESVYFDRTGTVWDLTLGFAAERPGFFDYNGYLSANADVRAAGIDAYAHYVQNGWREGRDASARFDTTLYLQKNPDVAAAGVNPVVHYLAAGQFEGRPAYEAVGRGIAPNGFDREYYLLSNKDVGGAGADPTTHYALQGWREGRDPSRLFDTSYYLQNNPDVRAAGINPLEHYNTSGWREGRDPSAAFDTSAYLAANRDVAAAGINPLAHYLAAGIYEGRTEGDGVFI